METITENGMTFYTFDLPLLASITIAAPDDESAQKTLQERLENCRAEFEGLSGEVSLMEDVNVWKHLGMKDGIDCVNQYGRGGHEP